MTTKKKGKISMLQKKIKLIKGIVAQTCFKQDYFFLQKNWVFLINLRKNKWPWNTKYYTIFFYFAPVMTLSSQKISPCECVWPFRKHFWNKLVLSETLTYIIKKKTFFLFQISLRKKNDGGGESCVRVVTRCGHLFPVNIFLFVDTIPPHENTWERDQKNAPLHEKPLCWLETVDKENFFFGSDSESCIIGKVFVAAYFLFFLLRSGSKSHLMPAQGRSIQLK